MAGTLISPFRVNDAHLYKEFHGAAQALQFRQLTVELDNADEDARTLSEALDVAGVPAFGSSPDGFSNLILVGREVNLEKGSKTIANITLEYESKGTAGLSYAPNGGATLISASSAVDSFGQQITTSHGGQTQGGEINIEYPITVMGMSGIIATDFPWVTSHMWVGRLNARPWAAGWTGVWKCTQANYSPIESGRYQFDFEFQADFLGHQPQIWFVDPSTGRPPSGLVSGVGYKTISWFPYRDFNQIVAVGG